MFFLFVFVLFLFLFFLFVSFFFLIIQSQAAFVNCLYVARFTIVHSKTQIKFALLLFLDDKTSFISEEYLGKGSGGRGGGL